MSQSQPWNLPPVLSSSEPWGRTPVLPAGPPTTDFWAQNSPHHKLPSNGDNPWGNLAETFNTSGKWRVKGCGWGAGGLLAPLPPVPRGKRSCAKRATCLETGQPSGCPFC